MVRRGSTFGTVQKTILTSRKGFATCGHEPASVAAGLRQAAAAESVSVMHGFNKMSRMTTGFVFFLSKVERRNTAGFQDRAFSEVISESVSTVGKEASSFFPRYWSLSPPRSTSYLPQRSARGPPGVPSAAPGAARNRPSPTARSCGRHTPVGRALAAPPRADAPQATRRLLDCITSASPHDTADDQARLSTVSRRARPRVLTLSSGHQYIKSIHR